MSWSDDTTPTRPSARISGHGNAEPHDEPRRVWVVADVAEFNARQTAARDAYYHSREEARPEGNAMKYHSTTVRAQALSLYAAGLNAREVADAIGAPRSTVGGWITAETKLRPPANGLVYTGGWVQDGYIQRPRVKSR